MSSAVPAGDGGAGPVFGDPQLWRAVDIFRLLALGYTLALLAGSHSQYRHPLGAMLVLLVMTLWTAVLTVFPARPFRLLVVDLLLATGTVLATLLVDDPDRIASGAATLPSIWPAAAVLSWAVWRGWRSGLLAGAVVGAADLVEVRHLSGNTVNNVVLLLLTGLVAGYSSDVVRRGRLDLARAAAVRAAGLERERLARDIHDSVLQVLGYISRRGADLDGEAAELAGLAGQQEQLLRALVLNGPPEPAAAEQDLLAALGRLGGPGVSVAAPAGPLVLPAAVVQALVGAAAAALDNVRRHVGPAAPAWLLVEDEGDGVLVTVRDEGPGIPAGRLAQARAEGRLGVSASIVGRLAEVGGRAAVECPPGGGTEVELRVSTVRP